MTVFYADDDPEDCELFTEAIRQIDPEMKTILAKDGREALAYLQNTPDIPDYIFLDINMPMVDGKRCLIEIKKTLKFRNTPVIMYSTTSDTNEIKEYYRLGAHDFLIKPNNFATLCESLESIFNLTRSRGAIF
ncbi:MAG TPA: response regulator [Chryseosolibacter sp.]|nr:response regulator [Chryseosolibacter sp.]